MQGELTSHLGFSIARPYFSLLYSCVSLLAVRHGPACKQYYGEKATHDTYTHAPTQNTFRRAEMM